MKKTKTVHLNQEHTAFVRHYVDWFCKRVTENLAQTIRGEVGYLPLPPELADIENQLDRLAEALKRTGPFHTKVDLPSELIPIFKRMIIEVRRSSVADIESSQEKTHNPHLLETLDEKMKPVSELMSRKWLRDAVPTSMPLLTKYIPLKRVEELKGNTVELQARLYDQKFRILQAPGLIIDDLAFYRYTCGLRGSGLVVAFIDVDNFKANFNERYGEIVVDRRVLPVLMAEIEAHVFNHGIAYRQGGDEFVLILPNMSIAMTVVFLDLLRRRIEALSFPGIEERATISIGFVYVDSECFLTDREIVEKANRAKKFAKDGVPQQTALKNRIASYKGSLYEDNDLFVIAPQYPLQADE